MEKMPDNYDALDFWLDNVGKDKSYCLALPDSMTPWYATNPKTRSGVIRVPMFDPAKESKSAWINRLKSTSATHVLVPRDMPGFEAAVKSPGELSLIYDHIDSGSQNITGQTSRVQSALFAILPGSTK